MNCHNTFIFQVNNLTTDKDISHAVETIAAVTAIKNETERNDRLTDVEIAVVSSSLDAIAKAMERGFNISDASAQVLKNKSEIIEIMYGTDLCLVIP